jgi:hypothetical protein
MYIPFRANDNQGNIHHLRAEYADSDETCSNLIRIVDREEKPVQFNPGIMRIGRFVLHDGTELDSNEI